MQTLEKNNNNRKINEMYNSNNLIFDIRSLMQDELCLDKTFYRRLVKNSLKFTWHIVYRNSDLFISCNKNIENKIKKFLEDVYEILDFCIDNDPIFLKSLSPIKIKAFFPPIIKRMCKISSEFNVGPMAAVAGAVNEFLSLKILEAQDVKDLIIENGGDVFIKSRKDLCVGVYIKNPYYMDKIFLKIKAKNTPCAICSSSGKFGHSLSLGKCDLAVVLSKSCISADAAATAIANSVSCMEDIGKSIQYFKNFKNIDGLLIIKDKKIGIWGSIELV